MEHYQTAIEKVIKVTTEVAPVRLDKILFLKRDQRKKLEELKKDINKQFSGLRFVIHKENLCDWYLLIIYRNGPLKIFRDKFIIDLFIDDLKAREGSANEKRIKGRPQQNVAATFRTNNLQNNLRAFKKPS